MLSVLCAPAQGQFGGFDWALTGNPTGSGEISGETMTIVGPNNYPPVSGGCGVQATWFETTTPVAITVDVDVDFEDLDIWPGPNCFDAPAWVIEGTVDHPPGSCSGTGWPTGPYHFTFDVAAGRTFGLGVFSVDCLEGPGVAHFKNLVVTVHGIESLAGALDPRLRFELSGAGNFGAAVTVVGDVDRDGVEDLAVGVPGTDVGRVDVFSGRDGGLLLQAEGDFNFGASLAAPGDVSGDGVPDLLVGAPATTSALGMVGAAYLVSGADGSQLKEWFGGTSTKKLGAAVASAGDVDADGTIDLLIGAPGTEPQPGKVRVVSGGDGSLLFSLPAPDGATHFGADVCSPGDVDGDAVPDVLIGAHPTGVDSNAAGSAYVFSGSSRMLLASFTAPGAFGFSVSGVGDVDRDGHPDFAVGAPGLDVGLANHGAVHLFGGATWEPLALHVGPDAGTLFGFSLAGGRDLDGDGELDLAVAAPTLQGASGRVLVLRPLEGTVVTELPVAPPGGKSLALANDFDGDGRADLVMSGPQRASAWHALHKPGPPRLSLDATLLPESRFVATIADGQPGAPALLVLGLSLLEQPFAGGTLVPFPSLIVQAQLSADGGAVLEGRWPASVPSWWSFWLQAWIEDPWGPQGFSATNAFSVSVE